MAKKGNRLREFEKNHRVLNISTAQEERKKKKEKKKTVEAAAGMESAAAVSDGKTEKKKKTRINWVKMVGLTVAAVFIVMVAMSVKNIVGLQEEEKTLLEKNAELLQLKEELLLQLDNVNSDEFIEEQARKELKLVKGNELIFYFPDDWEVKEEESE